MSKFVLFLSLIISLSVGQTVFEGKFILFFNFSNPYVTVRMCFKEQIIEQLAYFVGKHHKSINRRCFRENICNLFEYLFERALNV